MRHRTAAGRLRAHATVVVALALVAACGSREDGQPPADPVAMTPSVGADPGAPEPGDEAAEPSPDRAETVAPPPEPSAAWPACEAATTMPALAEENAAFVADVSGNVAHGLQVLSCARMSRDPGPDDLFGRRTFVACGPPRLCSAGEDGRRGSVDDACTELAEADSTARRQMGVGWTRRFLVVAPDARPGCDAADAAVAHFYASFIRGDDDYLGALPPHSEWSDRLERKMEQYARFVIRGARLQGLRCLDSRCEFEVYLQVSSPGSSQVSGGTDQGVVERRADGRWVVTSPPT